MTAMRFTLYVACILGACQTSTPAPLVVATPTRRAEKPQPPAERSTRPSDAPVHSCAGSGPHACKFVPSTEEKLCDQLRTCLSGWTIDFPNVGAAEVWIGECGKPKEFVPAPANSGIRRTAIVEAVGTISGVAADGWYLIAEREDGLCLIDVPLIPLAISDGYFVVDFQTHWDTSRSPAVLHLQAHEVHHQNLEEEELSPADQKAIREGTYKGDMTLIEYESCAKFTYEVSDAHFKLIDSQQQYKSCEQSAHRRRGKRR